MKGLPSFGLHCKSHTENFFFFHMSADLHCMEQKERGIFLFLEKAVRISMGWKP